jgi:hypothetical protein
MANLRLNLLVRFMSVVGGKADVLRALPGSDSNVACFPVEGL